MATLEVGPPHFLGVRHVGEDGTLVFIFRYNRVRFEVAAVHYDDEAVGMALVADDYPFEESIEGPFLTRLTELTRGGFDVARLDESDRLERQLANLIIDACLPAMQRLAPPTPLPAVPETLHGYLYPQTYTLQVLTEDNKLVSRPLHKDALPPTSPLFVSEEKLSAMGLDIDTTHLRVVQAQEVVLVQCLQGGVWRVTVDGQDVVYKSLLHPFKSIMGNELATYLKLGATGLQLKTPQLKGIVQSHVGVIGMLLAYIPHKHHSLRVLLDNAPYEATTALRQKWAAQIRDTLAVLHSLGILWLDIKTDNVLIDDDGDAVVLDFGGGNTVGWVDHDKYGTMEGELQGLAKIMAALEVLDMEEKGRSARPRGMELGVIRGGQ